MGSGQTGVQLAEELHRAGRAVVLSTGRCWRVPRRYRGYDCFWWIRQILDHGAEYDTFFPTVGQLPSPAAKFACNAHVSGHDGGHDTNLRQMGLDGIRLAGRFAGSDGAVARFEPDLAANLQFADEFFDEKIRPLMDRYAERAGIATEPDVPRLAAVRPARADRARPGRGRHLDGAVDDRLRAGLWLAEGADPRRVRRATPCARGQRSSGPPVPGVALPARQRVREPGGRCPSLARRPTMSSCTSPASISLPSRSNRISALWDSGVQAPRAARYPDHLVAIARTVASVWRQERFAEPADEIARWARNCTHRLATMAEHMSARGAQPSNCQHALTTRCVGSSKARS